MELNTAIIAATEVRLIEARCESLYGSPYAKERQQALSALEHLGQLQRQKTARRVQSAPLERSSAVAVRLSSQRATSRFAELDTDGNLRLSFEEFYSLFPRTVREAHGAKTIREWFDRADVNGDGEVSITEFFVWTLQAKQSQQYGPATSTLVGIFEPFDKQKLLSLNYAEFESLCDSVGFGLHTAEIFRDLDLRKTGRVDYSELESVVLRRGQDGTLGSRAMEFLSTLVLAGADTTLGDVAREDLALEAAGWRIHARDTPGVLGELQTLLRGSSMFVVDLMSLFTVSKAQEIDIMEFHDAMKKVFKCHAPPWVLDDVFEAINHRADGPLKLDEMFEFVRGRRHASDRRSVAARQLVVQPPPGALWQLGDVEWDVEALGSLMASTLQRGGIPIADFCIAWDRGGSGMLREEDVLRNMHAMFTLPEPKATSRRRGHAEAVAAREQLWQQEVRPVVLRLFGLLCADCASGDTLSSHLARDGAVPRRSVGARAPPGSADNLADKASSSPRVMHVDQLEQWLRLASNGRPPLKPRGQRSESAKHLPEGRGPAAGDTEAHTGGLSTSDVRLRRIMSRSTRTMLLRSQQSKQREAAQQRAARQRLAREQRRREQLRQASSMPALAHLSAGQLPAWLPDPRAPVGKSGSSAKSKFIDSSACETASPTQSMRRLTRLEALSGELQASMLGTEPAPALPQFCRGYGSSGGSIQAHKVKSSAWYNEQAAARQAAWAYAMGR